jgi:hypothetical protein
MPPSAGAWGERRGGRRRRLPLAALALVPHGAAPGSRQRAAASARLTVSPDRIIAGRPPREIDAAPFPRDAQTCVQTCVQTCAESRCGRPAGGRATGADG